MTAHKPGPWRAVSANDGFEVDIVANGYFVAAIPDEPGHTEANARLIAAAPELLMWLEFAVRRLRDIDGGISPHASDEIAKVIGKAKGWQS